MMAESLTTAEFVAVLDRIAWNVCLYCAAALRGRRLPPPSREADPGDGRRCVVCAAVFRV